MLGDRRIVFGTIRMLFFPPQIRAIGYENHTHLNQKKLAGILLMKAHTIYPALVLHPNVLYS